MSKLYGTFTQGWLTRGELRAVSQTHSVCTGQRYRCRVIVDGKKHYVLVMGRGGDIPAYVPDFLREHQPGQRDGHRSLKAKLKRIGFQGRKSKNKPNEDRQNGKR